MEHVKIIYCIVERGRADKVVKSAIGAGAEGATIFYARGTGVRQKLGILSSMLVPEKETIIIAARESQAENIFNAIVHAAELKKPGKGFAFIHSVDKAIGFLDG